MRIELISLERGTEIPPGRAPQLVEFTLMRAVESSGEFSVDLAAAHETLQLGAGFGMINHHHGSKGLFSSRSFVLRELARGNLKHVADGNFFDEVFGRGRNAERRIGASFLAE